jgi:endogenous inhibitor of DNA gyrase (YacG/DUF329 family)
MSSMAEETPEKQPRIPGGERQAPPPHTCPTCAATVPVDAKSHPFCSERCRMAELNNWFRERYVISRKLEEKDLEEGGS